MDDIKTKTSKTKAHNRMFDDVFDHVNQFSRYQALVYHGVNALCIFPMALPYSNVLWAMGIPEYHCADSNTTCLPSECCHNCTSYAYDGPFFSTASEWNLICEKAHFSAAVQMTMFVGMLFTAIVVGPLSDRFGRKICVFASMAVLFLASLGSSFANSVWLFGSLRFLVGCGVLGVLLPQYTHSLEILGPKLRTYGANMVEVFWITSAMLSLMVAYFIREWRTLLWVSSLSCLGLFPFYRSPRWLVANGLLDEALEILMKFGGKKDKPVDPVKLRALLEEVRACQLAKEAKERHTPVDLYRTPKMRKWTAILSYNWFVTNLLTQAFYLFITSLAGNMYLNTLLMISVGYPFIPLVWFLQLRIGRRLTYAMFIILATCFCLMIIVTPTDNGMLITAFAICGSAFTYGTYCLIYVMFAELFPTVIRNTALSTGSTVARLGNVLAPFMATMAHLPGISLKLPIGIFAGLTLMAAIGTYWIPETKLAPMHQTIEEAESAKDYYGMPCCGNSRVESRVETKITGEDLTDIKSVSMDTRL
ncbi:organic cation transporter protein isoform X2 [Nematostella vectensis]|uniref:organic cation transporter protein isoform X2 n=1 Tax=Nematostella vectensis TaxID=45351 RepID=UPI00207728D7|nr:organic cation transporter protein isoform X2 [Nematostella vectensis]